MDSARGAEGFARPGKQGGGPNRADVLRTWLLRLQAVLLLQLQVQRGFGRADKAQQAHVNRTNPSVFRT